MKKIKLLPCPFCGNIPIVYESGYHYGVMCTECFQSKTEEYHTEEEAIASWNTRKPMERIIDQLEEVSFERYENEGMGGEKVVNFDDIVEIIRKGGGYNAE